MSLLIQLVTAMIKFNYSVSTLKWDKHITMHQASFRPLASTGRYYAAKNGVFAVAHCYTIFRHAAPPLMQALNEFETMQILKKHEIDAGEKDENGYYGYYYEYDDYEFVEDQLSLIARSYADEPQEASFRAIVENGERKLLSDTELSSSIFRDAVEHLKSEGKSIIKVLTSEGYNVVSI
jgi:hypothetical protein